MALQTKITWSTISLEGADAALYSSVYRHTCSCCTSLIKPAGRTSRMLSRFRSFHPAMSTNWSNEPVGDAKMPAARTPTSPPSPNTQAFLLLRPCCFCFEIFSASVVLSPGRAGAGLLSRELLGVLSGVPTPKMRRRRSAMVRRTNTHNCGVCRRKQKASRCLAQKHAQHVH
jgi:hypothetical protein